MSGLKYAYIAEKPKVGRAIAEILARTSPVTERGNSFIRGKDWAVGFAHGHLFELQPPEFYISQRFPDAKPDAKGRIPWNRAHLPILPAEGEFALRCTDRAALSEIKKLVRDCEIVVHAGDPDREGQLVVDAILSELGNRKPVKRYIASGMDEVSVQRGLADLRDNKDFQGMRDAARARSFADWLVGMNGSRGLTLRAQQCGFRGSLSYGRVQTAVLGLIVQREKDILNFVPVDYLLPKATIEVAKGKFVAEWKPKEGQAGLDPSGKLIDTAVAAALQHRVTGQPGVIASYSDQEKLQGAPLPFSLAQLQILAGKKYGYSSEQTLKAVQALYDNKVVSYPRTGSSHLPLSLHDMAPQTLAHVLPHLGMAPADAAGVQSSRKSKAWDDEKSKAHHGIVPLTKAADPSQMSPTERNIYLEICRRYVAQFMPPRTYRSVVVDVDVQGERFKASGATTIKPGWKALYGDEADEGDEKNVRLPPMGKDDPARCHGVELAKKRTEPPARFTDSSLLAAMLNVHEYVTDPRVVEIFKKMRASSSTDQDLGGLGTPATRHTFAPKLIGSGYLRMEKGKGRESAFHPEPVAMALIDAMPSELGKPDTTAVWETVFENIEAGKTSLTQFLTVQQAWVTKNLAAIDESNLALPAMAERRAAPASSGGGGGRRFAGKRR